MQKSVSTKIKAFTIMEMTVAMVIASISIAITYSAFTIINQSYREFHKKNIFLAKLLVTDKLFKKDFSKAVSINKEPEGISFKMDSGIISYSFNSDYILRNQFGLRTDTLHFIIINPATTFEMREASNGEKIDQLSFQVNANGKLIYYSYQKLYSAADFYLR